MASTDDSEEAPTIVENGKWDSPKFDPPEYLAQGDVLCSEPGHDSSNMTASARGHAGESQVYTLPIAFMNTLLQNSQPPNQPTERKKPTHRVFMETRSRFRRRSDS
jgi:hypothetical protein